jgi:hypothetical protein
VKPHHPIYARRCNCAEIFRDVISAAVPQASTSRSRSPPRACALPARRGRALPARREIALSPRGEVALSHDFFFLERASPTPTWIRPLLLCMHLLHLPQKQFTFKLTFNYQPVPWGNFLVVNMEVTSDTERCHSSITVTKA